MSLRKSSVAALCLVGFFASQFAVARTPTVASDTPQHSTKTPSLDGVWLGTLHAGDQTLNLRLTIKADDSGQEVYTLYSLDQGAKPIPCTNVKLDTKNLSFDIPLVQGHWSGEISADGKILSGTWKQNEPRPLNFTRQTGSASK